MGRTGIMVTVEVPGEWVTLDPHARRDACTLLVLDAMRYAARIAGVARECEELRGESGALAAAAREYSDQHQAYRMIARVLAELADHADASACKEPREDGEHG